MTTDTDVPAGQWIGVTERAWLEVLTRLAALEAAVARQERMCRRLLGVLTGGEVITDNEREWILDALATPPAPEAPTTGPFSGIGPQTAVAMRDIQRAARELAGNATPPAAGDAP